MIEKGILFTDANREFEKRFIARMLQRHKGNLSRTAKDLAVFVGSSRVEPNGALAVPQQATFAPTTGKAATLTVVVTFKDPGEGGNG